MAESTGIAWTRSSWSPWWGCTEVSPGCDNCYARALDNRHRMGGAAHWGAGVPRYRTSAQNWKAPMRWNMKAAASGERWTVFPSMCDPFDNEISGLGWRDDFFELICNTPALTWLLLTKRIGNARMFLPGGWMDPHRGPWPNVWLGVSVVNQEEAARDIPKLLATPAAKRFVSYEPALGPVDFSRYLNGGRCNRCHQSMTIRPILESNGVNGACECGGLIEQGPRLDQVIVGGESKQGKAPARPFNLAWARSTVAQCRAAGVPVFVKQLGSNPVSYGSAPSAGNTELHHIKLRDRAGADPVEWPEDLRVQEVPA